ncbi:ORF6N domain-containing protein [Escherichia coli]
MATQISVESLSPITYNHIPVITTELLARLYGTDTNNIKVNHSRNADRFVCGKHFFKVVGDELKNLRVTLSKSQNPISPKTRSLILWTERGAARHAKMLETDQAWDVFEKLEDCYFDRKPANLSGDVRLSGGTDLSKASQVIEKFMPAIMEAIKLEDKKEYSAPLKPGYRSLIHSPSGVLGLTEHSLLMNLLNQLQEDGHDVSGAAAELTTMFCYIVGVSKCLRDIQTHAEYINDKAGFF